MQDIFFTNLGILLFTIIGAYLPGYLLLYLTYNLPVKKYQIVFSSLLTGVTGVVIVTSLIITGFKTINLGFILLIIWYWVVQRKFQTGLNKGSRPSAFNFNSQVKVIFEILVVALFVYLYRYLSIYHIYEIPVVTPDISFYSRLSYFVFTTGQETYFPDFVFPESVKVLPYHYYELWFNGIIGYLFNANYLYGLTLITSSMGGIILWVGYCAFFETFKPLKLWVKAICFLLLFVCGIYFASLDFGEIFRFAAGLNLNSFRTPKLLGIYMFFTAAVLSLLNKNRYLAYLLLLALPLVSFSTAPAILLSLFIYSVYLSSKPERRSEGIRLFLQTLSVLIFIGLFYWFSLINAFAVQHFINGLNSDKLFDFKLFAQLSFKSFGYLLILYLFSWGWLIGLALYFGFKTNKQLYEICFLSSIIVLSSIFIASGLGTGVDIIQIFWNISVVLMNTLIVLAAIVVVNSISLIKKFKFVVSLLVLLILLACVYFTTARMGMKQLYSSNYIVSVAQFLKGKKPLGVFIKDRIDYSYIYAKNSAGYPLGEYLGVFGNQYQTIALSVFEIPVDSSSVNFEAEKFLIKNASFYKYVTNQKSLGQFISVEHSQVAFIKEFGIEYILVSKNASLPEKIADLVTDLLVDPLSGEKCYILNPNK